MGSESSREQERKKAGSSGFSTQEKQKFGALLIKVLDGNSKLTRELLQRYMGNVFSADFVSNMISVTSPSGITEPSFSSMVESLVTSRLDRRAQMISTLAKPPSAMNVRGHELFSLVKELTSAYFKLLNQQKQLDPNIWELPVLPSESEINLLAYYSLNDLFYPDRKKRLSSKAPLDIPDTTYDEEDIIRWSSKSILFNSCFTYLFQQIFPVCDQPERSLLPMFVGKKSREDHTNLLSVGAVLAINQAIPVKLREKWTLLFDSRKHGESFTNLLRNVKQQKNTVLVVRDVEGNVFGGFSTAVWSNHAAFQGSIDNFLFSVSPTLDIYRPSGINTNYFYLNTGQETLPNGMGMGGQLEYFGLWLDCEYGEGHSMAKPLSTTYQSPTLSYGPQFKYTDLEVWRVSNIQEDLDEEEERAEKGATSILDSDPGAKAILEMVGKGHHSDGLRESDPTASNPAETEKTVIEREKITPPHI